MKKDHIQSEVRGTEDFAAFDPVKVPCSGAFPTDKLDFYLTLGKLTGVRVSNKHTKKQSHTLKLDDLMKDEEQAKFMGGRCIRRIEFEDPITGKIKKGVYLDQDFFLELLIND